MKIGGVQDLKPFLPLIVRNGIIVERVEVARSAK